MAVVRRYRDSAASAKFPDSWYLNYVSCTEGLGHPINFALGLKTDFTAKAPKGCNDLLLEMLRETNAGRQRGTFMLDFCHSPPQPISTIVGLNH